MKEPLYGKPGSIPTQKQSQDLCPPTKSPSEPPNLGDTLDAEGQGAAKPIPDPSKFSIAYGCRLLQLEIAALMQKKGWSDGEVDIPEKLCLIHSEISEALEAYRDGNATGVNRIPVKVQVGESVLETSVFQDRPNKPEGVITELADAVIRCFHLAHLMGADLGFAILKKHEYNQGRPYRHGGKKA